MAKHLFVIITRMHVANERKGTIEDEYTYEWRRDVNEEHSYFMRETCDVLLIHGYFEKYKKKDRRKEIVAAEIADAIQHYDLKLDEYDQQKLFVLYHGMAGFKLQDTDLASVFGERRVTVAKYSSVPSPDVGKLGPLVKGALKQLEVPKEIIDDVESYKSNEGAVTRSGPTVGSRNIREEFSNLKHQIGQLFLALSIDLQTIESVDGVAQLTYAKEILDERAEQDSLVQSFSELRFLVARVEDGQGKACAGSAESTSIWEWLGHHGLQESKPAEDLLVLSGIVLNDGHPAVDDQSNVSKYFAKLDAVSQPRPLVHAMMATIQIVLRDNNQSTTEDITFHTWLNKLDSVLDELRTIVLERAAEQQEAVQTVG